MNTDVKERVGHHVYSQVSVSFRQSVSNYNPASACLYVKTVY